MRVLAFAVLTIATVWAAGPVRAQRFGGGYPVCIHVYQIGGDYIDCAFTTLAQCAASASGRSAVCVQNPYFASVQGRGARRGGQ